MVRAMRVMAIEAVLAHRLVLPEKRPSLFGVALVALVVHRRRIDHLGLRRVVRVVAAGALHLAFAHRVMRGTLVFRANLLVAGEARLGVAHGLQLRLRRLEAVHAVAGDAPGIAAVMEPAVPVGARALLMTRQAGVVDLAGLEGLERWIRTARLAGDLGAEVLRDVLVAGRAALVVLAVRAVLKVGVD